MEQNPGQELAALLGISPPPNFGLAVCDDCGKDFRIGEYTDRLLGEDPFQLIVCRECHRRRVEEFPTL